MQANFESVRPGKIYKARSSLSNPSGRFEPLSYRSFDDGWQSWAVNEGEDPESNASSNTLEDIIGDKSSEYMPEKARSIVTSNNSPDIPFNNSINPYRGCEHGCIYCYARPSHEYLGFSPGLDFETKIIYKEKASELLKQYLRKKNYKPETIVMGANTDPYQPAEKKFLITRSLLEVFLEFRHPVSLITKSGLILRDLDILSELARLNLVSVAVSVTTLDNSLARNMEPRTAASINRIKTIQKLSESGVSVTVMAAPIIPALNDNELETILTTAAGAGARNAGYVLLRLPHGVKDLFREWLATHYPTKANHVMTLLRSTRNGKDYEAKFGTRMKGNGNFANLLATRFKLCVKKLNLNIPGPGLDKSLFSAPDKKFENQLNLF